MEANSASTDSGSATRSSLALRRWQTATKPNEGGGATAKLRSRDGELLALTDYNGKPPAMAGRRLDRIDAPPQQTHLSCLLHHNHIMTASGAPVFDQLSRVRGALFSNSP